MDVDALSFPFYMPDILTAISEAEFVSFDLELSGIPSRHPGTAGPRNGGRSTLEDRYQEAKEGANKHQVLQVGLTCAKFDFIANKYVLRPYNITISPLLDERLNFEREFTFQAGAAFFLKSHGFRFDLPFTHGVQYLSREEAAQIKQAQYDRIDNRNAPADMQLKETDVDSLDFLRRVREAITAWKETNRPSLRITTHTGMDSVPFTSAITRFEKRLVHQLVRAEFPDLVAMGKADHIKIIYYDAAREDDNKARQKHAIKARIREQTGFRWLIEALTKGGNFEELLRDPFYFAKNTDGVEVAADIGMIREKLAQASLRLQDPPPPVLVGHNMFTDLVYFYRCFIGPLPDTLDGFCLAVHELFPRIVDTKYLATHDGGDLNVSPTLQEVAAGLGLQPLPDIATHVHHTKYDEREAFHEAGYDSLLTATIMLRLSTKVEAAEADTPRNNSSDSFKTTVEFQDILANATEHMEERARPSPVPTDSSVGFSDEVDQTRDATITVVQDHDIVQQLSKKQRKKEKRKQRESKISEPTRFASRNAYAQLLIEEDEDSNSSSTSHGSRGRISLSQEDVPASASGASWSGQPSPYSQSKPYKINTFERRPMELMPGFDSDFWHKFGNKLRIFGTQESVLHIAKWKKTSEFQTAPESVLY